MVYCKKCNKEFTPTKGFIKYCSWECRSSRTFSEESKQKKSVATKRLWEQGNHREIDWNKINQDEDKVRRHKEHNLKITEQRILNDEKVWTGTIRKYLIDKHGHKCWICNVSKWKNIDGDMVDVPLVMDHINGNKTNNNLDNLRIICRNCDGLLPTFCSRNIGRYSKEI